MFCCRFHCPLLEELDQKYVSHDQLLLFKYITAARAFSFIFGPYDYFIKAMSSTLTDEVQK